MMSLHLLDPADHVAVHDLHVVDVEQQLHARRADLAHDLRHPVEVVALVAGVALHRVGVVARVEVLQADGHALLLRVAGHLLQPLDAVRRPRRRGEISPLFGSSASVHL